jgi:outer membrane lipoprotein-sorting protein
LIRTSLCAALLLFALPAAATTLDDVKASLKATTTMTAGFVQTAADGRQQTGKLLLARPGKIRFEYNKAPMLVVADGSRLTFVDYEVAQVSQWPIRSTPLGVLLDTDADLSRFARVTGSTPTLVQVEARDPKRPEYGAITLGFRPDAAAPGGLALLGWTSIDAQNNLTDVHLTDVRYNVAVEKGSFTFRDPRRHAAPGKTN